MLMGVSERLINKPFIKINGKELFLYGYETLDRIFDKIVIVCHGSLGNRLKKYDIEFITEEYGIGPIGGILAGSKYLSKEYVYVTGCDMPLPNAGAIMHLWEKVSDDGMVPIYKNGQIEPLHSFLRREKVLEIGIPKGHKIRNLLEKMNVEFMPVGDLRKYDEKLLTFRNINTQEDMEWLKNYI